MEAPPRLLNCSKPFKDEQISNLLERLISAGAAQPQPVPTFQVENSGDCKTLTTKEGEDLKPKISAGAIEKPKDKDEAEAQGKEKTYFQPIAARKDREAERVMENLETAKETVEKGGEERKKKEDDEEIAQGQKATSKDKKEEGEVAEEEKPKGKPSQYDKADDNLLEESGKSAREHTPIMLNELSRTDSNDVREPKQ
nr:neurofilament heavy polypeptide-like [Rhipicephalus microplus]